MNKQPDFGEWEFLIGYPLEQARELLEEEGVPFAVVWTAAPKKQASPTQGVVPEEEWEKDEAFVIAVRSGSPLGLVCAYQDWNVG